MPCCARSTRSYRRRRKQPPSPRRQIRLLMRLCWRFASGRMSSSRAEEAMARPRGSVAGVPPMVIVGSTAPLCRCRLAGAAHLPRPLTDADLASEARRFARSTHSDGIALCAAYRWQALAMSYRIAKWRRCLATTNEALAGRQLMARVEFGPLLGRRLAAGMNLRSWRRWPAWITRPSSTLSEHSSCRVADQRAYPCRPRAAPDVGGRESSAAPKPADGRKHRKPRQKTPTTAATKRKGRSRRKRRNRRFRS